SAPATVMTPFCVRSLMMEKYAPAALAEGKPCVTQTVFCPPAPSSTSALVNVAPSGGTGMKGALHAHSTVNRPSSPPSFKIRRRNAFMIGSPSGTLQQQGARRRDGRDLSRSSGPQASTLLAVFATSIQLQLNAEIVPLQFLLQAEAG